MTKKKLFYVVSLLLFVTFISSATQAYATEKQGVVYSESATFSQSDKAEDYINEQLMTQKPSLTLILSDEICNYADAAQTLNDLLVHVPLYYEIGGMSYQYIRVDGGTRFFIQVTYKTTEEQNNFFLETIDNIIDELDIEGKSEYEKVRLIHDYICDHVDYDFEYKKYTAYDALITGKAVCQGYANLFYYMCDAAGVTTKIISGIGNGGSHAWNIVKIGDVYYNIDVTWDGQSTETDYNFFLKNESEFGDHTRNKKYATTEYYSRYVMAKSSWIDFDNIGNKMSLDNIGLFTLDTIDGGKITNQSENNRPKLLLMGAVNCGYTCQTLANIASADFSDIDVVFIDTNLNQADGVVWLKEHYGTDSNDITYAYCESDIANMMLWNYSVLVGIDLDTYPLIIYIDEDNIVQYADNSKVFSASHVRSVIKTHLRNGQVGRLSYSEMTMYKETVAKLSIEVYGIERNPQFFTWISSDSSIATVDANGNVKAIGAGKAIITCIVNNTLSYTCTITVPNSIILNGLNKGSDGIWYYFKNNTIDTSYTGIVKNQYGWWYVKCGKVDTTYNGLVKYNNAWWYVKNGKLDNTYTGLVSYNKAHWYIKNGKLDNAYTGLVNNAYGWWYVKCGKVNTTYSGLVKYNNAWWYIKNGKLDNTYTGLVLYNKAHWYIKNGKLDNTYTGLMNNTYGWWYVKCGKVDATYTGLVKYNNAWWYVKNRKLDNTYTGLVKYNNAWWYVKNGKLDNTYTGLVKYNNAWWYIKNGKLDNTYTGLVSYNKAHWYVKNGKLDATYTGLIKNGYGCWYVKAGKVDFTYTGKFTFNDTTYTINCGKVTNQ